MIDKFNIPPPKELFLYIKEKCVSWQNIHSLIHTLIGMFSIELSHNTKRHWRQFERSNKKCFACCTHSNGNAVCLKKRFIFHIKGKNQPGAKSIKAEFLIFQESARDEPLIDWIIVECKTHCCLKLQPTNRVDANPRISSYTFHSQDGKAQVACTRFRLFTNLTQIWGTNTFYLQRWISSTCVV